MTPELVDSMVADIRARILDRRHGEFVDPSLLPELLTLALNAVGPAAAREVVPAGAFVSIDCSTNPMGVWAENLLCALHQRAITGIPVGEPAEPSFVTSEAVMLHERDHAHPWETTLNDGDGDLG